MAYLDYAGLQRYHGKIEENFAKIDGAYEGMTVGNAEELVTGLEEEESVPFIFRTSGGQLEIGSREDLTVVGGSLVWNQAARPFEATYWQGESNVTVTCSDGVATISSGTAGNGARTQNGYGVKAIKDHKYFGTIDAKCSATLTNFIFGSTSGSGVYFTKANFTSESYVTISGIKNCIATTNNHFFVYGTGVTYTDLMVKNFMCIDLTQLFGSTIADYIYALEQNTAGAGVAFFKRLFPKSYYPYNAGELLSVNASAFKTVGFNAYNAETHTAKVLGGIEYKIEGAYTSLSLTDIDGNISTITPSSGLFTPNANGTVTVTGYGADTCIFIHWDNTRDGEYEPYVEHSYPLDSDLTLRGIPKLDADNNLYYDGDTYEADGTVTRKYGVKVYDGTESFSLISGTSSRRFTTILNGTTANGICSHGEIINSNSGVWGQFRLYATGNFAILDNDSHFADVTALQAYLAEQYANGTPLTVIYELATPTTETADAFQKPQIVDNWGTEEFAVTEQSGVAVPVGHNTIYPISLRDKLEAMPNLPSEDGDYILRMRSGAPAYIALANEFPAPPTTDGTYTLKATVSSGAATLTWEEVNA